MNCRLLALQQDTQTSWQLRLLPQVCWAPGQCPHLVLVYILQDLADVCCHHCCIPVLLQGTLQLINSDEATVVLVKELQQHTNMRTHALSPQI